MPGPLAHSPQRILQALIVEEGFGTDPEDSPDGDWPVFYGREADQPDDVVMVSGTEGRHFGHTQDGEKQTHHGFQVMVRSGDIDEGEHKAREIALALNRTSQRLISLPPETEDEPGTSDIQYLISAVTITSDVIPLGVDQPGGKRQLFTVNGTCSIRRCA